MSGTESALSDPEHLSHVDPLDPVRLYQTLDGILHAHTELCVYSLLTYQLPRLAF